MDRTFTADEAAEYLRGIADALEKGCVKIDETELEVEGPVRVKGTLEAKPGKTSLKMKLRFIPAGVVVDVEDEEPEEAEDVGGQSDQPYKKLKKAMGKKFKSIQTRLKNEVMPPLVDLDDFYRDCLAMTGYPGNGDEYYEQFNATARQMMEAAGSEDISGLRDAVEALGRMKRDCHALYK